ncbi:MAG: ankyrin repeat domain-containing protein [Elusimicrobiota bacterium]|nr:ankyrin repeat domain-containing protein [Elusimicrobiota bacterium]
MQAEKSASKGPVLDLTNEDTIKNSFLKVQESLPEEKRASFEKAVNETIFRRIMFAIRVEKRETSDEEEMGKIIHEDLGKVLHGKNADEIFALAEEIEQYGIMEHYDKLQQDKEKQEEENKEKEKRKLVEAVADGLYVESLHIIIGGLGFDITTPEKAAGSFKHFKKDLSQLRFQKDTPCENAECSIILNQDSYSRVYFPLHTEEIIDKIFRALFTALQNGNAKDICRLAKLFLAEYEVDTIYERAKSEVNKYYTIERNFDEEFFKIAIRENLLIAQKLIEQKPDVAKTKNSLCTVMKEYAESSQYGMLTETNSFYDHGTKVELSQEQQKNLLGAYQDMQARTKSLALALIKAGADVNDCDGESLLKYGFRDEDLTTDLVKAGAKVDAEFIEFALQADNKKVLELIKTKYGNIKTLISSENINNLLINAVEEHNWELADKLIDEGADANAEGGYEQSVLWLSLQSKWVASGERPDMFTPQRLAFIYRLLNNGANADKLDDNYKELLIKILENGGYKDIKNIIIKDIIVTDERLAKAAFSGKLPEVKKLLEDGANINGVDKNGKSALYTALFFKRAEVAGYLLEKGADVNAGAGKYTALQYVRGKGYSDVDSYIKFLEN